MLSAWNSLTKKKFDPTACTADQRALIILQSAIFIISFQLKRQFLEINKTVFILQQV